MPSDPNIPLSVQTPQPYDPMAAYGRVLQLQSAMQGQQLQQAQLTGVNQENQMRQVQIDQTQKMNDIYAKSFTTPTDGTAPQLDPNLLTKNMAQAGLGSKIPDAMKHYTDYQQSLAGLAETNGKVAAQQSDAAGSVGMAVKKAGYDPNLLIAGLTDGVTSKALDPKLAMPIIQQLKQAQQQDPTGAAAKQLTQQFADNAIARSPKAQELLTQDKTATAAQTRAGAAQKEADNSTTKLNAELPGITADTQQKQRAADGQTLYAAAGQGPAAYAAALAALPTDDRRAGFPTADQWKSGAQMQAAIGQAARTVEQNTTAAHQKVEENQGAQHVAIDQKRLATEQYNAGLGPDGKPLQGSNLTGDAYMQTLPFAMQQRVRAIDEGREPMPTGRAASSGPGRLLAEAVTQFDPGYSVQRGQLRSALTTGAGGNNIGALNTAVVHIDQYTQALQALQNNTFRPGNKVYNDFVATFGNSAPTTAQGIANAVAGETATALKGNATDPEIASVKSTMPQNGSPQQIADYAKSQLHVLGAKLNTYDERYQAQAPGDKWSPVLPTAQAVFSKYGVQPLTRMGGGATGAAGNATTTGAPAYKVGDSVLYNGAEHKVIGIKPNGKLILDGNN